MGRFQYKYYLLILLTIVGVFNLLDRYVLALAMEPIKQEFQLNDSQLGFLSGFAFALFYAVAGVPIARWADRGNRSIIVSFTTGLWSVMIVFCAMVGNFTQLLLVRVGVAVGEAGCAPTAQSLIASYFERAERPHAMAIYWLCAPLAIIAGFLGGGLLIEQLGWRITFMAIGMPGILLAILAKFTLREPREEQKDCVVKPILSFKAVITVLWKQKTFRSILLAFCLSYFFSAGYFQWLPTFFIRSHGMSTGELGLWFAFSWGGCGLIGTYLGGVLSSRYAANNEVFQMKACGLVFGLTALLFIMVFLSTDKYHAMLYVAAAGITTTICNGAIFSAIQSLVNDQMRSVAIAIIFLMANLVGLGLGPLATGLLSDILSPRFGQESLRYSLAVFSPGLIGVAFYYWQASKTIESEIRDIELELGSSETKIDSAICDAYGKKKQNTSQDKSYS